MEFTRLRENLSFHPNLFPENPMKPQLGKKNSMESLASKELYQNFLNFDQFTIEGSSLNSLPPPFVYPSNPFQASSAGEDSKNLTLCTPRPFAFDGAKEYSMHGFPSRGLVNFISKPLFPNMDLSQIHQPLSFPEFGLVNYLNLPDEVSCPTAENVQHNKKADPNMKKKMVQTTRRSKCQTISTNVVKGQWTLEEDRMLVRLVKEYGVQKWSQIAHILPGRIGKQCRERWHNHLRPDIKKDKWSEEEDMILIETHRIIGNRWAEIARRLPGRSENTIKNHWNATLRRHLSSNKTTLKTKYNSTLLQNYIQTLISRSSDRIDNPLISDSNSQMLDTNTIINPQLQVESSSFDFALKDGLVVLPSCENDNEAVNFSFGTKDQFPEGYKRFDGMPCDSIVDDLGLKFEQPLELDIDDQMQFDERKEMDFLEMLTKGVF